MDPIFKLQKAWRGVVGRPPKVPLVLPRFWGRLLALLGGTPGAILGMWTFRHKTRHWYFRWGLPVLLTLQLALWFGWEYGAELL